MYIMTNGIVYLWHKLKNEQIVKDKRFLRIKFANLIVQI